MILTGTEIKKMVDAGDITIVPFNDDQINPNSYNYRLGPKLLVPEYDEERLYGFKEIKIPEEGYVLEPHTVYLGHTHETLGSKEYAMSLIGRSSLGRLGLFLQISANLGHTGSCHQWTLEIVSAHPFRVYPMMRIGQISFWCNMGHAKTYDAGYSCHSDPEVSKFMKEPSRAFHIGLKKDAPSP
ncbi:MAG: dCTP deaminase [Bdellovibrionales bacterium]